MINKKIASEVAVGIILLLVIVLGGIFWIQSREVQAPAQQAVTAQPATQSPQTQKPIQPVDEATNWQTYTNTKYGFEFKYPKSINFISEKEEVGGNLLAIVQLNIETETGDEALPLFAVGVYPKKLFDNLSVGETRLAGEIKDGSISFIEKGDRVYTLGKGFMEGSEKWLQFVKSNEYKEILSTFKFTDVTADEL